MKKRILFLLVIFPVVAFLTQQASANGEVEKTNRLHGKLQAAPRIRLKDGTSTNWSGYAVETNLSHPQNDAVTDVKGNWTVPTVTCPSGTTNSYSASWIGIDGDSDNSVEQTGTEQDCINGQAAYSAWFEMYPHPSYRINSLSIQPGDTMQSEVSYVGRNVFTLILTDVTRGQAFTTNQKVKALRKSAEWIMEAPYSGGVLPLADFGTIPFTNTQATLNGHPGAINDSVWQHDQITMVNSSGTPKAIPSSLPLDGKSFSVTWKSN